MVPATEHPLVARDTVIDVDDEVSRSQALEDVARDDAPHGLRTADADAPEELAIGDEHEPVRPAGESAVEAPLDEGNGAGRRRVRRMNDGNRVARLIEELGETGRLVAGEDDPPTVRLPALDRLGDACRARYRQLRLVPAEHVAGAEAARRESGAVGHLGLPGQLERPAADEPALPVAWPEIGRRPVLRQLAALDQLRPALIGLPPEEVGRLRDVAWLVEDQQGRGLEVVEAGGRGELGGPHLGCVADGQRPGRRSLHPGALDVRAGRRRAARPVALEPGEIGGESLGKLRGGPAEPVAERGDALVWREELRRGQEDRLVERADGSLVGRIERPERVDLIAEELDPDGQRGRGREHVDDPPASGELAATGDLSRGRVAQSEELAKERLRTEPTTDPQAARLCREIARSDRVLEQALDARDQDPGVAAAPGGQRRDTGGRFVGDKLAPLVGESRARFQDDDGGRVAEPGGQLLRDPIADLGVAGDPGDSLADSGSGQSRREERLRAVRHRAQSDVAAGLS